MSHLTDESLIAPGATLDDLRRQNLTQVLRLAHHEGPLSRADLTRATGLNRSTIGGLVGELQVLGLLDELDAEPTRRVGRPSRHVAASDRTIVIAVNPEVDAIDIGVVAMGSRILHRVRYRNPHPPNAEEFVNIVETVIDSLVPREDDRRLLGVALAIPGLVRESDGTVLLAPHLGWRDESVGAALGRIRGLRVVAGNDANCGVVAESAFGAARRSGVVVYLNGGASGIGSGITVDGQLLSGQSGHAGEFGHTLVNSSGVVCHCGAVGCLETEVRREALMQAVGDVSPEALGDDLRAAWNAGDGPVRTEITRQLGYIGTVLRTIVNTLNPQMIVLGGFLASILDAVGADQMKAEAGGTLPGGLSEVEIVSTALGDDILLVGAAEMLFQPLIEAPAAQSGGTAHRGDSR